MDIQSQNQAQSRSVYATVAGTYQGYFADAGQHTISGGNGSDYIYIHVTNPFNLRNGDPIAVGTYLGEYTKNLGSSNAPHVDVTLAVPNAQTPSGRYVYPLDGFGIE